jgi:exonuclease SbcC
MMDELNIFVTTIEVIKERICNIDINDITNQLNKKQSLEKQVALSKSELVDLKHKIEKHRLLRESLKEKIELAKQKKEEVVKNLEISKEVTKLFGTIETVKNELYKLETEYKDINKQLGLKETELQFVDKQILELEESIEKNELYALYVEALSKDGIPFTLLKMKLPLLCNEVNKILTTICNFTLSIEFNEVEDTIDIYIYKNDEKRIIELAGGAEKFLSSIALRIALLNTTMLPKSNCLIIDEGFGSLDEQNLDNISKMFSYLRNKFKHVILVSHIDFMKDNVDHMIEISKVENGDSLVVYE